VFFFVHANIMQNHLVAIDG